MNPVDAGQREIPGEESVNEIEANSDDALIAGLLTAERLRETDLEQARRVREQEGGRSLLWLMVRLGLLSERDVAETIAQALGDECIRDSEYPIVPPHQSELSLRFMRQHHVLPIDTTNEAATVVFADPRDSYLVSAIRLATGREVNVRVGTLSEIDAHIERLFGEGRSSMDQAAEAFDGNDPAHESREDVEHLRDLASEAPVIRVVNIILRHAIESRASDIHIESTERGLRVRCRIDGVLHDMEAPPSHSAAAVISRIKILGKMDIAERRLPQDGRIRLRIQGHELDIRVSTVPTVHGESVVMRLLDKDSVKLDFEYLGFEPAMLKRLQEVLRIPHGIVLVTGPTGSGKTTTLYTALEHLNDPGVKIITVEDPVEYQLEGINQIQVKPSIGLTFPDALRSILRQDPDIILIGEMRDVDTARIAIQAALTGHTVLSTLHTNDAPGAVQRLLDMGVEEYLIASSVNAVIGERLVRRLCPDCRTSYVPGRETLSLLGVEPSSVSRDFVLHRAAGCSACEQTGYLGRFALVELMEVTDELRKRILDRADKHSLREQARQEGMQTMSEDGLRKCWAGDTSVEELIRVTQLE